MLKNMSQVDDIMMVLGITAIGGCIGFIVFILNHEKEHKKEMREKSLREANNNKNRVGQHDKSGNDEPSSPSTAPTTSTKAAQTSRSI